MNDVADIRPLLIGVGGLGAPALLSMLHRGVRQVGILEPDRVELGNLHRQILYREADVGAFKVDCVGNFVRARFPHVALAARRVAFDSRTHAIVSEFDVVLDGTDRFETKLAISDVCTDRKVPYVFAAIAGTEGQVMGVVPDASACPRCLFDEAPPPGAAPTCTDLGILGPIAGIVAARQVATALIVARGDTRTANILWTYDGRANRERTIEVPRASDCRGCGTRRHLRGLHAPIDAKEQGDDAPVLDLSTLACPETFVRARQTLETLALGAQLWLLLDSDESLRQLPASFLASGHRVLAQHSDGRIHRVLVERGA